MRSKGKSLRVSRSMTEWGSARARVRLTNNLNELEELARDREQPGVVLLELASAPDSGIRTLIRLHEACPEIPIVVVSEVDNRDYMLAAFAAGATGYIRKSAASPAVSAAMRFVAVGETLIPAQVPAARVEDPMVRPLRRSASGLSQRQMEVLHLAAQGLANKDIARALKRTENTVKVHLRNAYAKLGVSTRTQAMVAATRLGIKL